MSLENLNVKFTSDTVGLQKGFKSAKSGISQLNSGIKKVSGGISSLVKSGLALAGVTIGITQMEKAFVGLESSVKRVGGIFGDATDRIKAFAEQGAKAFGMSETSAYEYAATYGNLFKNITADTEENAAVTIAMLKASAVVASKTRRTMEDVNDRIRSGLLGSTEAIEDLGINVNVAMLEMTDAFKRIANGRSWNKLTFYEQQQIRTLGILEQANNNFGDTVQTGSAFSLNLLSQSFKDLTAYGGAFINAALQPMIAGLTQLTQWATAALKALAALMGLDVKVEALEGVEENGENIKKGLDDAADSAKKLNRQLSGFDKFNDITPTPAASDASPGAPPGSGGLFDHLTFDEYEPPNMSWMDDLKTKFEELKNILSPLSTALSEMWTGFTNAAVLAAPSLDGLWTSLEPFGSFAIGGLADFVTLFLTPIGVWTLGEGLPRLAEVMTRIANGIDWDKLKISLADFWDALAKFQIGIGDGLLDIAEALEPFTTMVISDGIPAFLDGLSLVLDALTPIIDHAKEGLEWFITEVLTPFAEWFIDDAMPAFFDTLSKALEFIDSVLDAVRPGFEYLFEKVLKPIAEWTGGLIIEIFGWIGDAFKKLSNLFIERKEDIDFVLKGISDGLAFLWKLIQPGLETLKSHIKNIFDFVVEHVTNKIDAFITILKGIITFVQGVFSGDWGKAWEGVKTIVTGIWDDIWGSIKAVINLIIGGVNAMIKGLNKISFDIPDWDFLPNNVQGKSFGISIPEIPKLAKGGLAFGEVSAIVGDNFNARHDPEVISPLSSLQEIITGAMLQRDIAGGGNNEMHITMVTADGMVLADFLIDPLNQTAKNNGYQAVFQPA